MIHLIRDSTRSELVYAEQCDMGDLESVGAFAALWNSGDKKQQEGVRRLDALLFLPPGREELQRVRLEAGARRRYEEVYQLHVLARFHLVNSLLSGLLVQPREREVRVVSVMSPFYAAGLGHFDVLSPPPSTGSKGKSQLQTLAESSFSALLGAASLRWYVLTLELQRRLDLLAEADPRPRTKLAGIDLDPSTFNPSSSSSTASSTATRDEAEKRMRQHSNINIINVCPGFERTISSTRFSPPHLHLPPRQRKECREVAGVAGAVAGRVVVSQVSGDGGEQCGVGDHEEVGAALVAIRAHPFGVIA